MPGGDNAHRVEQSSKNPMEAICQQVMDGVLDGSSDVRHVFMGG